MKLEIIENRLRETMGFWSIQDQTEFHEGVILGLEMAIDEMTKGASLLEIGCFNAEQFALEVYCPEEVSWSDYVKSIREKAEKKKSRLVRKYGEKCADFMDEKAVEHIEMLTKKERESFGADK